MKSKDLMPILVVALFSAVLSIIISNAVISSDSNRDERVKVVSPISADFTRPSTDYYNDQAINPTQIIRIGEGQSEQPFSSQQQ